MTRCHNVGLESLMRVTGHTRAPADSRVLRWSYSCGRQSRDVLSRAGLRCGENLRLDTDGNQHARSIRSTRSPGAHHQGARSDCAHCQERHCWFACRRRNAIRTSCNGARSVVFAVAAAAPKVAIRCAAPRVEDFDWHRPSYCVHVRKPLTLNQRFGKKTCPARSRPRRHPDSRPRSVASGHSGI